jgi:hypothetical protein
MNKIRKAITAGLIAAAGAVVSAITTTGLPKDSSGWLQLLGAAAGVGLAAALAVWRVPNAPAVTPPADGTVRR